MKLPLPPVRVKPACPNPEQRCKQKKQQIQEEKRTQRKKESVSLTAYFQKIYFPAISQEKKEGTAKTEEQLFRRWVKPIIGEKPIKDISPFDVERIKKEMFDVGRAPRTIEYVLTTLGQIFRHAEKMNYFSGSSPQLRLKSPNTTTNGCGSYPKTKPTPSLKILQNASQQLFEMSLLSLHCGLRAGEVFP